MSFDALTLSAVRDELDPMLTDSRVQKVVFPDEMSLAIEVFAPGAGRSVWLMSAHAELGRVQRLEHVPRRGLERDTPFLLTARKHLRNARIRAVRQPRLERVLELDCEQRDDSGRHVRVLLIVEAMGRRGNLLIVGEDGLILDAARRSPPSRNPRRPVLPHLPYISPPAQDRLLPEQITADTLAVSAAALLAASNDRPPMLARFLSDRLAGLSPLAGRELAFRATGSPATPLSDSNGWTVVADTASSFFAPLESHTWEPTLAVRDGRAQAYAAYALRHLAAEGATLQTFATASEAIDAFYALAGATAAPRGDTLAAERKALLAPLERALNAANRRIAGLEHQLATSQTVREPLRRAGEYLLAYQAEVPPGQTEVVLDGETVDVDPRLSAVENAQALFARYRKAREAEERVPELLQLARQDAEYLAELRALVEVADQMDAIRALRREVSSAVHAGGSGARGSSGSVARSAPYRRVALGDGYEALVGTSAAGNALVTFDLARPDDTWLHARGVQGAHVIVRNSPPAQILERAARLAAWHSAARGATAVEVDVALRRYVKKIPNGPPGLVRYSNERTLRVEPRGA
jgi:predicted ribosome quality control (RQC) complex YloA/Tae2 family protein